LKTLGPARPACDEIRSFFDSCFDEPLNFFKLRPVRHRTEGTLLIWVADKRTLCSGFRDRHSFCMAVARYEHACRSITGLTAIRETPLHSALDGHFEVRIIQNDVGGLPA